MVKRDRKVGVFWLIWTLILGFQVGAKRTIKGLRQTHERAAGHRLVLAATLAQTLMQLASVSGRVALGSRAGRRPRALMGPERDRSKGRGRWIA